ncbi:MAG TPA: M23 family metallopeptidase [Allosphingosinicella sp.]|jgi:murein DD-endopeptidase MepM/ murein hydrolase activator NlpD
MRYAAALAIVFGLMGAASATQTAPGARIFPVRPIAERGAGGESLNFDIILRNAHAYPIELTELDVAYLDAEGAVLISRRVDGNGGVPSIATLGARVIAPGAEALFFNPFPRPPPDIRAHRVRVRAAFGRVEGQERVPDVTAEAQVDRQGRPRLFTFPLAGRVLVWDGHDALSHHRRWNYVHPFLRGLGFASNAMRYSYDFVPVDENGSMTRGQHRTVEDYIGFGAPIRATASGRIVAAVSDRPDDGSFDPAESNANPNALLGNHVVIDHGDGSFSIFAHVRQNSVSVQVGSRVEAGDVIAAIGSSGSSLFPHLHYQLVDAPTMRGEGLPSYFRGISLRRGQATRPAPYGRVDSGDVVLSR